MPPAHAAPRSRWRVAGLVLATSATAALQTAPVEAATVEIVAMNRTFAPSTVSVAMTGNEPGFSAPHAHVVWSVADAGTEHTVTFDDPKLVSSPPLGVGKGHEVVIYEVGTYAYRCTIHPTMVGSIVVTPVAATTTAPPGSEAAPAAAPTTAPGGEEEGGSGTGAVVGVGAAGVAVAAGLGWLLLHRRRASADHD